jgi:nucleoside-diphosphate-sugar epimerase
MDNSDAGANLMHVVILGFGYSARAIAEKIRLLTSEARITITRRGKSAVDALLAQGWDAHVFDGDQPAPSLSPGLLEAIESATHILVSAPPDERGDPAIRALEPALLAAPHLSRVLYLSTVGVYGDHQGAWVDEGTPCRPSSPRSHQRLKAEQQWQTFASNQGADLGIFRLSGIYGPGRSAIDNLKAGTARRIIKPGQVFNRIHVADIAGAIHAALHHPSTLGIYNLTDDEPAPPQDVVAYGAALLGLPCPPDIPFESANLSEMGRSFYGENKRVTNQRIKAELGYTFICPTYREGLRACLKP